MIERKNDFHLCSTEDEKRAINDKQKARSHVYCVPLRLFYRDEE